MLCKNNLIMPSIVIVVWVEMKCTLLETKLTTIITTLYPNNSRSSTMKSILIVSYLVFGIASRVNSPSGR